METTTATTSGGDTMSKRDLPRQLSRRKFGLAISLGALSTALQGDSSRAVQSSSRAPIQICIFSKHLQWLDYAEMAEAAAELNFDGIDLTVRPGGHVLPDNVERDLPSAVKAVRSAGLDVLTMTTAINDPDDPATEKILGTASDLGIRFYRTGYFRYEDDLSVDSAIDEVHRKMEGLARLNARYEIRGNYQNHAGTGYFGASLWDLREVLNKIGSDHLGSQFDIRHAVVEGAFSWAIDFRALSDYVQTAVAKDFYWKLEGDKWDVINCPLGEGVVDFPAYLKLLRVSGFSGPFSLHLEYPLGGAESGRRELSSGSDQVLTAMRRDLGLLRRLLEEAGFPLSSRA